MCSLLINPWFNNQLYDIANIKITKFYTKEELMVHFNELKELFDEKKIFNSFNKAVSIKSVIRYDNYCRRNKSTYMLKFF